mmetsp:Transcript_21112/g.51496  ORF Transcript_21112/g.51496 Transcript_21112/m.51496 type:complete len:94 (-) Transcript_21112:161-442(-)
MTSELAAQGRERPVVLRESGRKIDKAVRQAGRQSPFDPIVRTVPQSVNTHTHTHTHAEMRQTRRKTQPRHPSIHRFAASVVYPAIDRPAPHAS